MLFFTLYKLLIYHADIKKNLITHFSPKQLELNLICKNNLVSDLIFEIFLAVNSDYILKC